MNERLIGRLVNAVNCFVDVDLVASRSSSSYLTYNSFCILKDRKNVWEIMGSCSVLVTKWLIVFPQR